MSIEPEGEHRMGKRDAERAMTQWLQRLAAKPPLTPQQRKAGAHWQQRQRDEQIWQLERDGVPHLLGKPSQPDPNEPEPDQREAAEADIDLIRQTGTLADILKIANPGEIDAEIAAWTRRRERERAQEAQQPAPRPAAAVVDPAAERRAQLQARYVVLTEKFRAAKGTSGHHMRAEMSEIERELFSNGQ